MMNFDNYFRFTEFVGLLNGDRVRALGLQPDCDTTGQFQPYRLKELLAFVDANPVYHIVTETSDSDDFDSGCGCSMDNEVRYVNRLAFYLADGYAGEAHLFEEDAPDETEADN